MKLILLIIFFPVIFWFYGTLFAIALVFFIFLAQFIQDNAGTLFLIGSSLYAIYLFFKFNVIGLVRKRFQVRRAEEEATSGWTSILKTESEDKFVPSSNLYCYWCSRKLGIKSWEKNGKFYCDNCYLKLTNDKSS